MSAAISTRQTTRRGFTLLEILAVVALMALLMTFVLPNFGSVRASALRQEARTLASQIEFTRQEAVVKGAAHRLLIEVDTGGYRVEWYAAEEASGSDPFAEAEPLDLRGSSPIPMSPPASQDFAYRPVSNKFGGNSFLGRGFYFSGVETADGWIDDGDVAIVFDRDGSSGQATIVIADEDQREIYLEVEPLLEIVRIRDVEQ